MARKLKVFGGDLFYKGGQFRVIVATTSKNSVAKIIHETYYQMAWWTETGNDAELELALKYPGRVLVSPARQYDRKANLIPFKEAQEWFDNKYGYQEATR